MMTKTKREARVRVEHITEAILLLRGHRVILDAELASLYDVTTKRLNEQVKRNARGRQRVRQEFLKIVAAYNLVRLRNLLPEMAW